MKVLKFGGTSVGSAENLEKVLHIVKEQYKQDKQILIVVSAFGGVTNQLVKISKLAQNRNSSYRDELEKLAERHKKIVAELKSIESAATEDLIAPLLHELSEIIHGTYLLRECSPRSLDLILSFGERLSAQIISSYFRFNKIPSEFCDARTLIITDDQYGGARINLGLTNKRIVEQLTGFKKVQVVTGFISATEEGVTTTLGRDGSDYSAAIFASALNAEEIQIWTDVNGVMTSNPALVPNAFSLDFITYEEAMELSHFGAKVLHPPTIQPAMEKNIPIRILNTFNPAFKGTLVSSDKEKSDKIITGLTAINEIALLTIQGSGMVGVPGVAARLFQALATKGINVILITQASSEHSICVAVKPDDALPSQQAIEKEFRHEISAHEMEMVHVEADLSILAVVGRNMRSLPGISGKIFNALGKEKINVVAISQGSSELNISVVVKNIDQKKALNVIHEAFYPVSGEIFQIYLAGVGLIGSELLKQIAEINHPDLKVCAVANSKKVYMCSKGVELTNWRKDLDEKGEPAGILDYAKKIIADEYPKKIFVDCTANETVASIYEDLLKNEVSVVAANKIAKTQSYKHYLKLRELAHKTGLYLNYETNVGAGLPVIETIQSMLNSGDKITRIEAILSGTLSYLFNTFRKGVRFADVVRQAKEAGFTEPDPRVDLSGMDVARKILILARESGANLELKDVKVEGFLPQSCIDAKDVDTFFKELEKNNDYFDRLLEDADKENRVLRYIARFEENNIHVGLQKVDISHPFYFLKGSDNILAFASKRYNQTELVIRGPGAGAEVTAAGVLADILKILPKNRMEVKK
jgi:aspartokinase/homoserine dehydrogenase 1